MIKVNEAIEILEKDGFNDDVVRAYEHGDFYYFDIRPKGVEEWREDPMIKFNKQSGEYSYLNYVNLILDGIADELSPISI